jgi:hypothetical protein
MVHSALFADARVWVWRRLGGVSSGSFDWCGGALVVEGEEACEELLVCQVGGPVVGGEDGGVEGAVGVG